MFANVFYNRGTESDKAADTAVVNRWFNELCESFESGEGLEKEFAKAKESFEKGNASYTIKVFMETKDYPKIFGENSFGRFHETIKRANLKYSAPSTSKFFAECDITCVATSGYYSSSPGDPFSSGSMLTSLFSHTKKDVVVVNITIRKSWWENWFIL